MKLHTSIEAIYDLVPSFDDPKKLHRKPHNTIDADAPVDDIIIPSLVRTISSTNQEVEDITQTPDDHRDDTEAVSLQSLNVSTTKLTPTKRIDLGHTNVTFPNQSTESYVKRIGKTMGYIIVLREIPQETRADYIT